MPMRENSPSCWLRAFPWPKASQHKYDRGHVLVRAGGIKRAGAARLCAHAAQVAGAGLVTLACEAGALPVYASAILSLMLADASEWQTYLDDARITAVLIGPGTGVSNATRAETLAALAAHKSMVIDADAITAFAGRAGALAAAIASPVIVTPHEGEFARLFPALSGDRASRAQRAAALLGAVIVLKGAETLIAHPDGRLTVNHNAPPTLATAGTGDVLAGITAGLLAQGMDPYEAASAAVWLHGAAAARHGLGLVAEDLARHLPSVLNMLQKDYAETS